ncbi:MAG TPA: RIP metalloprotease RseP [Anaerovoracaceae bacterium]|nr:RIP metalloprotease RseP [Anaerovoracaceae bacterium]
MQTLILTLLLFCLLIIPHELGHFIVAKLSGVQVNEFSIGMGPAIFKRQGSETLYSLRAIPIGGYCAMEGENEESENPKAFNNKRGWQKILVLIAGATMNVIVAIIVMGIALSATGMATNVLESVDSDGPAYQAGIKAGDEIVEINGENVSTWNDVSKGISSSNGNTLNMVVKRELDTYKYNITPKLDDDRYVIGIASKLDHSPLIGIKNSIPATWNMNVNLLNGFKEMITGGVSKDDISGPVGIVSLVGDTSEYGIVYFLYLSALISLNIAIINLLPLPALDGGRIIFVIIRGVTGNMISDNLEGKVHTIGMLLLLLLFVLITWNDILRLFS